MAALQQPLRDIEPDKAGSAEDQDMHSAAPDDRSGLMVRDGC
jgi:hypothetical protein